MNFKEFKNITEILELNYKKEIPEKILKIWYHDLKKYSVIEYKKIILQAIRSYKFLPTLAEILNIELLPDWLDKKIEKQEATVEQRHQMEELLKKYRGE